MMKWINRVTLITSVTVAAFALGILDAAAQDNERPQPGRRGPGMRQRGDFDLERFLYGFAVLYSDKLHRNGFTGYRICNQRAEFVHVFYRQSVLTDYDVAGPEARLLCGLARLNRSHEDATCEVAVIILGMAGDLLESVVLRILEVADAHSQPSSHDFPLLDELIGDALCEVGGHSEAYPHEGWDAGGGYGGVYTYELAVNVGQRAAGVAGIYGGVGLDEVLVTRYAAGSTDDAEVDPSLGRHDTGGHSVAQPLGLAEG